jgi:cadmium resistance protein CadD (predicted permease)
MRLKLFVTEAERQRARTRIVGFFFGAMFIVLIAFLAVVAGRYAFGWW